jgi:hypothetical protein
MNETIRDNKKEKNFCLKITIIKEKNPIKYEINNIGKALEIGEMYDYKIPIWIVPPHIDLFDKKNYNYPIQYKRRKVLDKLINIIINKELEKGNDILIRSKVNTI